MQSQGNSFSAYLADHGVCGCEEFSALVFSFNAFFASPVSGPGQSYSLSSTDVGDEFVSDCELLASRLANGLDGSDDTQGVKKACH